MDHSWPLFVHLRPFQTTRIEGEYDDHLTTTTTAALSFTIIYLSHVSGELVPVLSRFPGQVFSDVDVRPPQELRLCEDLLAILPVTRDTLLGWSV